MIHNQSFAMNPQAFQSIKLMELPIIDLREKIEEELERNPALEILEDKNTVSIYEPAPLKKLEGQGFIEGALSHPETLQEHLLWQLRLEPLDEKTRQIAELLIQNLDGDGFNEEPIDLLLKNEDPEAIKTAVKLVQGLDPAGTCCADYMESLMVQIQQLPNPPKGIIQALSHLELLERSKTAEAAKLMALSEEEVIHIFAEIKKLSPFPGRRFAGGDTRFVIPDIQVVKKEGEFVIILNEEDIPVLGINPFFMKIVDGERKVSAAEARKGRGSPPDKPTRDFARENIKEARWFINSINHRNHTLLRVSRAIVEFQRPFFTKGPKYLAPLNQRDIAEELALHESTISRTAHGKYMQTEWGIFELRHFFSNSVATGTSKFSREGVKEIIREIINEINGENSDSGSRSLSDQDISKLLAGRGINLARRTVAKYRAELDLGSSFER